MSVDREDVRAVYRRGLYPWTPARLGHRIAVDEDGCWIWQGARQPEGYGRIKVRGRMDMAHRLAYRLAKGAIPAFFQIDHLCFTPSCVNPDHLEAVTAAENVSRSVLRSFRYGRSVLIPVAALEEWIADREREGAA